jgi:hypothetical protein
MSGRRVFLVERDEAETYVLVSLVTFAATVILVRLFLELTGYPQVGSSTLHIAHLLWGGLLLFLSVLMVLIWDNPHALTVAAAMSGVGIGLFVDEVGKFITQNNDYFFPPAAPIVYGIFLLTVLIYLYVRKPDADDPRRAMVKALEELQDAIYGEMDRFEVDQLLANLETAQQSKRQEIAALAGRLHTYVQEGNVPFKDYDPNLFRRAIMLVESWGLRLGRRRHRVLLLVGLGIMAVTALVAIATLVWVAVSPAASKDTVLAQLVSAAEQQDVANLSMFYLRFALEVGTGAIALFAIYSFLQGNERRGVAFALVAAVLSLTAVQLLTFYLDQFTAVLPTLFQFGVLVISLQYRQWYLASNRDRQRAV